MINSETITYHDPVCIVFDFHEMKKREIEWLESMDKLVAELESMGFSIALPCRFTEIPTKYANNKI